MPFRFDGIETGLWNHDAAEAGVLSGLPIGVARRGVPVLRTNRYSEPRNRSICGDLGVARRTRANDRNSLSRDQATPHRIEIVPNIKIVPGPIRCRLHLNGIALATRTARPTGRRKSG